MALKDTIVLGCVADDFTGASDAASFIAKSGAVTVLCDGIPNDLEHCEGCQAIVIALKTRSVSKDISVRETAKAMDFISRLGAKQFYLKYCSTFDCTRQGNIGPNADSVMEEYGIKYTLLCPSLPVNKRVVKNGRLFVDGVPLDESHMKNHPLNPMWDSYLAKLMEPQSKYPCLVIDRTMLYGPESELRKVIDEFGQKNAHFYIIPDYETDEDGARIASLFGANRLLTGGSGLLEHLAAGFAKGSSDGRTFANGTSGRGIALCGSCSKATGEQIRNFKALGRRYVTLDPALLLNGKQNADAVWNYVQEDKSEEVLVYSIGAEVPVKKTGDVEKDKQASGIIEKTMAEIGRRAKEAGFTRIIVGGGETSGAVTQALSLDSFYIGSSVAPGVPIMIPTTDTSMRIVLKSGNFGQPDFFSRALDMTRG